MPPWRTLWRLKKSTFTRSYTNKSNIASYFMEVLGIGFILSFCFAVKVFMDVLSLGAGFWWVYAILGILGLIIAPLLPVIIKMVSEETPASKFVYRRKLAHFSFIDRIRCPLRVLGFKIEYSSQDNPFNDIAFKQVGVNAKALLWMKEGTSILVRDTNNTKMTREQYYRYSLAFNKSQQHFYISMGPFFKFRFHIIRKAFQFVTLQLALRKKLPGYGVLLLQGVPYLNIYAAAKRGIEANKVFQIVALGIPVKDYEDSKDLPVEWLEKAFPLSS